MAGVFMGLPWRQKASGVAMQSGGGIRLIPFPIEVCLCQTTRKWMKTQELPPPEHRSNRARKWVIRGALFIVVFLMILVGDFFVVTPKVQAVREVANEARARSDVEVFKMALDAYATQYGYHPEGAPAELLRTLRGDNKGKIVFIECVPRSVNARGEYIDPWGQPYHVDQSDPSNPRVYSSGPNGLDEHGAKDSDDIVAMPGPGR
jgi:type II secretory pathway pseudopilin PulG